MEETRLGTVGIVMEDLESSAAMNTVLHRYADIIVGRLGIPYRKRGVAVIALAEAARLAALPGEQQRERTEVCLGRIRGGERDLRF